MMHPWQITTIGRSRKITRSLVNDSDIESSTLTPILVAEPLHGTITLNSNGSFTYTPYNNYSGTDTFRYQVTDGEATSNTITVPITVGPKFYVVDPDADAQFRYKPDGTSIDSASLASGNNNARGVTSNAAGDKIWVLDSSGTVFV